MTTTGDATRGPAEIVATAGSYYRNTRYIITAVMIGMGLWFGYDGFVNWPEQNRKIAELEAQRSAAINANDNAQAAQILEQINKVGKHHTDTDLFWQRVLFLTLPPLGIALLARWIYISRGAYRLTPDNILHVPGHPPVPLDRITELDKRQWDRKGIAHISYELPDGQSGTLKLDDFVYQRDPTDEIFKRIEEQVAPDASTQEQPQESTPS